MIVTAENIQEVLEWVKTCPFNYSVSSLSTGHLHIKVAVVQPDKINFSVIQPDQNEEK
tara:strand:+ start:453 stop:626 length:174 start_codon:yes stop_codon:yes gene_type:complete